jgi:hypothetical protein
VAMLVTTWSGDTSIESIHYWEGPLAAQYTSNLRHGLATASKSKQPVRVVDGIVPSYVVPALFGTYSRYSSILPLFDKHVIFGPMTGPLWQVTPDGGLQPVTFAAVAGAGAFTLLNTHELFVARSQSTTDQNGALCVESGQLPAVLTMVLPQPLPAADWHLVVIYQANKTGNMFVYVNRGPSWVAADDTYIPIAAGTHPQTIDLGGPALSDLLLELPARMTFCLSSMVVGELVARTA